ncbi:MAG: sigma-70 family RNA polymerase sigma factor [Acidobacteriota bacterium]
MAPDIRKQDEFARVLEEHRRIVFKVANTYCRELEDRADLAQEIAAQLWRAYPSYDHVRPFSTWMYRIALNVAISYVRTSSRRAVHTVPLDDQVQERLAGRDRSSEADERVRELYRIIDQLDTLNRALLLLYLDEHSYREIADILGISESNVATKISRLKQRLRDDMKGN